MAADPVRLGSLFGAIAVLAAMPSTSVLTVVARSATLGFVHGCWTTSGVVAGDVVWMAAAIWGLSALANAPIALFAAVKLFGGAYLLWLGWRLWRSRRLPAIAARPTAAASYIESVWIGLSITLGDQKAIAFYLGFFPAFLDLDRLSTADTLGLVAAIAIAVGSVKLAYAALASRARSRLPATATARLNALAAIVTLAVGGIVLVGALGDLRSGLGG